ncbi:unnamed protein product, partial [Didymodactylos carnosus]
MYKNENSNPILLASSSLNDFIQFDQFKNDLSTLKNLLFQGNSSHLFVIDDNQVKTIQVLNKTQMYLGRLTDNNRQVDKFMKPDSLPLMYVAERIKLLQTQAKLRYLHETLSDIVDGKLNFNYFSIHEQHLVFELLHTISGKTIVFNRLYEQEFLKRTLITQNIHFVCLNNDHFQNISEHDFIGNLIITNGFQLPIYSPSNTFDVYELYTLPSVTNGYLYQINGLPRFFGLNSQNQAIIEWSSEEEKLCLFDKEVLCKGIPLVS